LVSVIWPNSLDWVEVMHEFVSCLCLPPHRESGETDMAFKTTKAQLAQRDALAAELRSRAYLLNVAIGKFNRELAPLTEALVEAQANYNETMEHARTLASEISEPAQEQFDAKSERWQDSDAGTRIRTWIEQWEMSLDDVDLDLPEPLEEIDADEHASILEGGPGKPEELEYAHQQ
jgi:hypothetical protein